MARDEYTKSGSSPAVWDSVALSYDQERASDLVYAACIQRTVEAVIAEASGGLVLDAGCGTGLTTLPLFARFDKVVGTDYSLESLIRLRDKVTSVRLAVVQSDLLRLPFASDTFDAVMCANTLQHFRPGYAQRQAAAELIRVAKPGAPVVISVHHYSTSKRRAGWVKEGKPGQPGIDYIFRFSPAELLELFPRSRIGAIGLSWASRLPRAAALVPASVRRVLGPLLAKLGRGHMLLAIYRK